MKPASQNQRVLTLLTQRRPEGRGLNTTEVIREPTADGGEAILRLARCIGELQAKGHKIRPERRLNGTATYHLVALASEVERDAGKVPAAPAPGGASPAHGSPPPGVSLSPGLFDAHEFSQGPDGAYGDAA